MKSSVNIKQVMVFDVETTGLLNTSKPIDSSKLAEYPYVLQLSYIIYNISNHSIVKTFNEYVRIPQHIVIPEESIAIHGITRDVVNKRGKLMFSILQEFYQDFHNVNLVIAHNLSFDSAMISIEMKRNWFLLKYGFPYALSLFDPIYLNNEYINTLCTMKSTVDVCCVLFPAKPNYHNTTVSTTATTNIRYKWPTLLELYFHLFQENPENLHDAFMDCLVCLRSYLKLWQNYHIPDEEMKNLMKCSYVATSNGLV
jgi:DNA polymerase III epsilon subunit-like protein